MARMVRAVLLVRQVHKDRPEQPVLQVHKEILALLGRPEPRVLQAPSDQ